MKNSKKYLQFELFFLLIFSCPLLMFSADNGKNPAHFDPDAPAPIDPFVIYFAIAAITVAFYYLVLKKKNSSCRK